MVITGMHEEQMNCPECAFCFYIGNLGMLFFKYS